VDENIRKAERDGDVEKELRLRMRRGFPIMELLRGLLRNERVVLSRSATIAIRYRNYCKPVTNQDILTWLKNFQDIDGDEKEAHKASMKRTCCNCNAPTSFGIYAGVCVGCGRQRGDQ